MQIDEKDLRILELLKQDGNRTSSQLSKIIRLPITTIHNRIKKLIKMEVIKNYTLNIDYEKIGKPLMAYILITVNQNLVSGKKISQDEIGRKIKSIDGVEKVAIVTGSTDVIVIVRARDMHQLSDLITKELRKIDGVDKTQTMMVLEEI